MSTTPYARIAAVTGGNRGIGYAITHGIASRFAATPSVNNGPLLLYLGARDGSKGKEAVARLCDDLRPAKVLRRDGGLVDIKCHQLDVSDEGSIGSFEAFLKQEHAEGLDILVNNAGVSLSGFDSDIVRKTLAINYYGTMSLTERLLPHMRQGGRIVNMASMLGKLNKYSPAITSAFKEAAVSQAPYTTDHLMQQYQEAVDKGTAEQDGWPMSAYAVSKAGLIGATMYLGKQEQRVRPERNLHISACCPGYVKTDMTKQRGRKTPEQGALTPVHLALGDLHGVTGEFWEHEQVSSWT